MATASITEWSHQSTFIDSGNPDYVYVYDPQHTPDYTVIGNNSNDYSVTLPQTGGECIALYSWYVDIPTTATDIVAYINLYEFYNYGESIGVYGTGIAMLDADGFDPTATTWNNQPAISGVAGTNLGYQIGTITFPLTSLFAGFNSVNKAFALVADVDFGEETIYITTPTGWGAFCSNQASLTVTYTYPTSYGTWRRRIISW